MALANVFVFCYNISIKRLIMRNIFIDLDGVLADFDRFYFEHFGVRLNRQMTEDPPNFRKNILGYGRFYYDLPLMPDAMALWDGVKRLHPAPAILTGVREDAAESSCADDKRAWVAKHLGPDVPVFTSRSKDKRVHGKPGDILVDDWFKYQPLWEDMGGIFILHTSTADSLPKIAAALAQPATISV